MAHEVSRLLAGARRRSQGVAEGDGSMSGTELEAPTDEIVLEYELDAPVEKVWRAISIPAFRAKWLPTEDLVDAEPVLSVPREEVRYRMRDDEPPFLESTVTFQVLPN